ncbi:MAG TPA: trypsin-like peptidase domain-containing protein, partial [Candidatus Binatia bacterium]|nr:trypsin-like peptidase domain-containing protein [Candidatus Binatia bacterium]
MDTKEEKSTTSNIPEPIHSSDNVTSDLKKNQERSKLLSTVILLSFIFGVGGSVIGATYVAPLYQEAQQRLTDSVDDVKVVQVDEQSAVVDVVKRASPAVVSIIVSKDLNKIPGYSSSPFDLGPFSFDPFFQSRNDDAEPNIQEIGGGTGFIITEDGIIATNKHVVDDPEASYTVLTTDGKKYDATVLSRDPVNDLALVKIQGQNFPTLTLGESSKVELGQRVIAIGNSLAQYQNTVTTGVVSGIGRTIIASGSTGSEQLEGVIQTDAAINPGNSGGPLLDIGGSVIGINTAIDAQGQLVGFAIPVDDLKRDLESFKKFGKIVKPFLGIRYVLVTEAIKEENNLTVDYGALIV